MFVWLIIGYIIVIRFFLFFLVGVLVGAVYDEFMLFSLMLVFGDLVIKNISLFLIDLRDLFFFIRLGI